MKFWLVIFVLLIEACSSSVINPDTAPLTATLTNTAMPPVEPTKTVALTPTQFKTITRTSVPTLPVEEAEARALELLRTNADCSLPCWWGITAGVNTIDDARSTLEPFLGAVYRENQGFESSKAGGYYFTELPSGLRIGVDVLAEGDIVSLVYIGTEMTKDIYTRVYDDPFYQDIMSAYTLEAMLTKYGKPDQILIRSFSDLAGEFNPTQILLFYPDRGIVVQYFSRNLPTLENEAFILWTCPSQSHISLRLFDPGSHLELSEILAINDSFSKYKNISKATDMDIETFVQTYQEYNEYARDLNCPEFLKTPEDIWPNEYRNP